MISEAVMWLLVVLRTSMIAVRVGVARRPDPRRVLVAKLFDSGIYLDNL